MKKSLSHHKRSGIYLASMPVIQGALRQTVSQENGSTSETHKKMSPKRAKQVVAIFRGVSAGR